VIENVALVNEIADKPLDPLEVLTLVGLEQRVGHFPLNCPEASSSVLRLPAPSSNRPTCCCATSRPGRWTTKPARLCWQPSREPTLWAWFKRSRILFSILNVYLRDAHTGHLVTSMSVDFRGNTDESWSRAANYLVRNRLLAPNYGAPQ
jgi:hypothetical protein